MGIGGIVEFGTREAQESEPFVDHGSRFGLHNALKVFIRPGVRSGRDTFMRPMRVGRFCILIPHFGWQLRTGVHRGEAGPMSES